MGFSVVFLHGIPLHFNASVILQAAFCLKQIKYVFEFMKLCIIWFICFRRFSPGNVKNMYFSRQKNF